MERNNSLQIQSCPVSHVRVSPVAVVPAGQMDVQLQEQLLCFVRQVCSHHRWELLLHLVTRACDREIRGEIRRIQKLSTRVCLIARRAANLRDVGIADKCCLAQCRKQWQQLAVLQAENKNETAGVHFKPVTSSLQGPAMEWRPHPSWAESIP